MKTSCLEPRAGFTLIELLVTLMLMSVTATLVAPSLFNALAGIEQKSAIKEVAQDLSWLRNQAFLNEYPLDVALRQDLITAWRLNEGGERLTPPYFEKHYALVSFREQSFSISRNGAAKVQQVVLDVGDKQRSIEVDSW